MIDTDYAVLADEIIQLKKQAKEIKDLIDLKTLHLENSFQLGEINSFQVQENVFEINRVRVTRVETRRWSYSERVQQQIDKIKEVAQLTGEAQQTASTSFRFKELDHTSIL